ncbi:MAG TPA: hypothetical protein VFA03_15670 [Acetobacteraceae bacterium]|nr:hypothetical protein [Acetobacteraceae bacterium]
MDEVFAQAVARAEKAFGDAWMTLGDRQRADAIYREMRRIDAERAGVSLAEPAAVGSLEPPAKAAARDRRHRRR